MEESCGQTREAAVLISRAPRKGQLINMGFSTKLNSDDWLNFFYDTLSFGIYL